MEYERPAIAVKTKLDVVEQEKVVAQKDLLVKDPPKDEAAKIISSNSKGAKGTGTAQP